MRNFHPPTRYRVPAAMLCGVCFTAFVWGWTPRSWAASDNNPSRASVSASLGALPMSFEPNVGQFGDDVSFYVRGAGYAIAVAPTEAKMLLPGKSRSPRTAMNLNRARHGRGRAAEAPAPSRQVKFELVGASKSAPAEGEQQLPGIVNYLLGNDPSGWKTGITTFERARFRRVYPGIDLVYYGNQSRLEYDFIVSPHANPRLIRLHFTGADDITVEASGDLSLHLDGRQLRWQKPVAYQEVNGERRSVDAAYRLKPGGFVEFELGDYDNSRELVIDPLLIYNTYLGGTDLDSIQSMTVDAWGNVYFAGLTYSVNFPVFRAYRSNAIANADAFVTKLNSNATALVFSTYFGGGSNDWANAIDVDSSSNVFVGGFSDSVNLPMRNAFKNTVGEFGDGFLTKFGPFGSNLLYSTYYGDANGPEAFYEEIFAVAVNNAGHAWVAGTTESGGAFNSKSPIQNGYGGGFQDAMVARFDTTSSGSGSLIWGSWLGGNYNEGAYGLAVDTNDNCYVVGNMYPEYDDGGLPLTPNFPIVNAFQSTYGGGFNEGFLVKINNSEGNPTILYSTFLGGADDDAAYGVTVDSAGQAIVCGETSSPNFPVVNGHQSYEADGGFYSDAFLTKFNAAGSALLYSTYFGGTRSDGARSVLVDRFGHLYLAGYTQSGDLAVTADAVKLTLGGASGFDSDLFVAKFNPAIPGPSGLVFSTYYGGSGQEAFSGDIDYLSGFAGANLGVGLGLDTNLNFYIASDTLSTNLPVTGGAYRPNRIGDYDVFAAKIASPVDISVGVLASTGNLIVGSNLTYSIYVNNNGLTTFTNALVTAVLPASVQLLGATNTGGVVSNSGNTVYFAYGNLTNSAARQSTILVRTLVPAAAITNVVTLTATPTDANTNNNRAFAITAVRGIANLALGATVAPNPVLVSSNLVFTLSITNLGPWLATDVRLTNSVPAGVSLVSAVPSQGAVGIANNLITVFLFGLASNGVATVTLTYKADSEAGVIINRAGVYHHLDGQLDPVLANNSVATTATINALTDVRIGSSINTFTGPTLYAGSNLTYRVFVTNDGPSAATSVSVTHVLPPGAAYVSSSVSRGSVSQSLGVVTWNVTSLNTNQSADLSVTMRPTLAGLLTNTAVIASSAADPLPANNTSSAVSLVVAAADVVVSAPSVGSIVVTSNLTYSLTVSNRGPTFASNLVLTATLPLNTLFIDAPASQGSTQLVGNVFTANIGLLQPATAATITLRLRPMLEGPITTPVTLSSGVFDPVAANNSLTLNTTVTSHPGGPILRIALAGTNVVLYWTTNSVGYSLRFVPDSVVSGGWSAVTNVPVVRGTQYFVTNAIVINPLSSSPSGGYYRLHRTTTLPALTISVSGTTAVLSWPTTFASWSLQSTPEFLATNVWLTLSNKVLVSGRYYSTQTVVAPQQFYRLNPP